MQKNTLKGKVALITGAARRIGAEIACYLHEAGMNVALHYHTSEEEAFSLCERLNERRENSAITIAADLQDVESNKILIQKAAAVWQRLDVLINNASRFYRTTLGKVSEFAWDDLMNTNLRAPFFLSQAAAPFLKEQHGSIINITDINSDHALHDFSVYCISKSGLVMLTKALARDLGPDIRVNAIAPGPILWPEGENKLSNEEKQKIIAHTALRREGNPSDIAKAVLFFVRDAEYVTGQMLNVDGGKSII